MKQLYFAITLCLLISSCRKCYHCETSIVTTGGGLPRHSVVSGSSQCMSAQKIADYEKAGTYTRTSSTMRVQTTTTICKLLD